MDSNTSEKTEEMVKLNLMNMVVKSIEKQGFPFLLLALAVWYFHGQNNKMQVEMKLQNEQFLTEIQRCNEEQLQIYRNQSQELLQVVERNSKAFEAFSNHLSRK